MNTGSMVAAFLGTSNLFFTSGAKALAYLDSLLDSTTNTTMTTNFAKMLVFVAALLVITMSVVTAKMHVWVYAGLYPSADRWSMKFSTTQKCYTFSSCVDDSTVGADWEDIDDALAMVFYEKEQCQGTKLISHAIPKGQVRFTFEKDKGAKSFMVWSDGMYATNGIEHECLERATINAANATDLSGSSTGFLDIVVPS